MIRCAAAFAAAVLLTAVTVAAKDEAQRGPRYFFLERSYFFLGTFDKKPAAESSPHRFIVDLSVVKDQGRFRGWGLAFRFYRGQDFNNLLFVRDIQRFQIGLAVDQQVRRLD